MWVPPADKTFKDLWQIKLAGALVDTLITFGYHTLPMRQLNPLHTPCGELNSFSRTSALEPDTHSQTPTHPWPPTCRLKPSSGQNSVCLSLLVAMSMELEQSPHGAGIGNEQNKHRALKQLLGAEGVGPVPWALNGLGPSGSEIKKSREGGL